jgi:hypothetical protein
MTQTITLKEFATVNQMIMFYAKHSLKSRFEINRVHNIFAPYSEVKREFNYAIASHTENLSNANKYDELLNGIPEGSVFMGGSYLVVGFVRNCKHYKF